MAQSDSEEKKPPGRAAGQDGVSQTLLLGIGVALLLLPIAIAYMSPTTYHDVAVTAQIIVALGGGMVGGFMPGALQFTSPTIKASGALGVFVMIFLSNPASDGAKAGQSAEVHSPANLPTNGTFNLASLQISGLERLTKCIDTLYSKDPDKLNDIAAALNRHDLQTESLGTKYNEILAEINRRSRSEADFAQLANGINPVIGSSCGN